MRRSYWLFALAIVALASFACSQDGGSGFTDNPVAPATGSDLTAVTGAAQQPPALICHNDVDDEHPEYESISILVNGNSVNRHFANHGDCFTNDPVDTLDCGCAF